MLVPGTLWLIEQWRRLLNIIVSCPELCWVVHEEAVLTAGNNSGNIYIHKCIYMAMNNDLWLQYFSVSWCLKVQNCLYDSQSGISFPCSNSTCSLVMPTAEVCHYLYCAFIITKLIVCCVLYMMLSFWLTEMQLCLLRTKAGFRSFLFSSVDLYITDRNKFRYVAIHEFIILSFSSVTVKVELSVPASELQFFCSPFHHWRHIQVL